MAEEEWAKAAKAWVSVNDRFFTMKERMEPWHDLWTLCRDQVPVSDEVMDGHLVDVLGSFWADVRNHIVALDKGRAQCAKALDLPLFGVRNSMSKFDAAPSAVPWFLV
eukprot:gene39685-48319_t